ncbi:MAG TPA: hypothetical protein VMZ30_11670 [Pyrinomonadaceae bacterium]|nr:hypothetical protein [Pyrinomonadaceae bacterium]
MNPTKYRGEIFPTSPRRLRAFGGYFKGYASLALTTAALPVPTGTLALIPTYQFQTKLLPTLASVFCFLTLAFLFYLRHRLARLMFPRHFDRYSTFARFNRAFVRFLPLALVVGSIFCIFNYWKVLNYSIEAQRVKWELTAQVTDVRILETSYQSQVPEATKLMVYYLAFFMSLEGAFTLMALKEYLQDALGISDLEMIDGLGNWKESKRVNGETEGEEVYQQTVPADLDSPDPTRRA